MRRFAPGVLLIALSAAALSGCGGGDEESPTSGTAQPPSGPPTGSTNRAPTISGTAPPSVNASSPYSFAPTAADADGDTLAFSIQNKPAWATFNTSTGRITGTPSAAQVGAYANVRITVSDGALSANLAPFNIQVVATASGSVLLTWNPPTQNTDGSPLTNLAGYKIYWGLTVSTYTNSVTVNNPGLASYVVDQLTPATWFFAVTALSASGAESPYSNVASKQVQ